ncbi:hypothetical protein IFM89_005591 [Coptis chinensis]|uniref:Fe-S metabolism associated domain-containing protein n=1 Tax=Coptis chinensis TaxID=261450 RepID=A0A835IAC3_9MAGN|nr:hypothetical protein IFM89_005591 [Coptis chinensis]
MSIRVVNNTNLHPNIPKPNRLFSSISIQRLPTRPSSTSSSSSSTLSTGDLPPKLQEIVNLFQSVDDNKAKYQQLMFYGRNLKPLDPKFKTKENKVQGCVSQVWVRAYLDADQNVYFEADSDSALTKGLAALLVQGLSGQPVSKITTVSKDFIMSLGLQQSLTASRNNGFVNMLGLMKRKAQQLSESGGAMVGNEAESLNPTQAGAEFRGGERIKDLLVREFSPIELEVEDISHQHAGHAGVGGAAVETHFNVKIVSKVFEGKSLVKRHRLVYDLLQNELQTGLHALSIVAKTPSEVSGR